LLKDEENESDASEAIDEEKLNIKKKSAGMSEYTRRREENIARNKELLKATMLGSGYSELVKDLKNEAAKKKKAVINRKNASESTKQADGQIRPM